MSITTQAFRLALSAAALCAAMSSADAKPRRLVILDFDGPRQLADSGRSSVLAALGQQYDVVATKRWESARAAAAQQTHGPAQWSKAAKQAGVDAVIEGWVQDEGRRKILNVVVREASNGKEFDTITVRFDGKAGMSGDSARQLATSLDEVLDWINEGQNETPPAIPTFDGKKAGGSSSRDDDGGRVRVRHPVIDEDGDGNTRVRGRHGTLADDEAPRRRREDDDAPRRRDDDRAPAASVKAEVKLGTTSEEPADGGETVAEHEAKPVEVSVATRDASAMEKIFPQDTLEHKEVFGEASVHVPQPTKRFMIDAGGYYGSRSLTWSADPDANVQQFAGVSSRGVQVNAAIYPWPTKAKDGVLSGIGFTGELHHSLGSSVISDEEDTINEYVINQNGFELGAHYRAPLNGLVAIDGGVFYGNQTYEIVDASPAFETPDTKYSYLGAGVHLDLAITDHAQVGFGARYFTVLDSGDLQSTDFFGPAQASGLGLEGSFVIPLPASLYVRGQIAYQRIALELSGGGVIADEEGVTEGKDSTVVGNVNVGISF